MSDSECFDVSKESITCTTELTCSYYWGDAVKRYPSLAPRAPYIVDPANPANNMWFSGFKRYAAGEKPNDYEPGDGNSTVLKRHINTMDLSIAV